MKKRKRHESTQSLNRRAKKCIARARKHLGDAECIIGDACEGLGYVQL